MIIGIGTDIVEICRIKQVLDKQSERFQDRIYTDEECRYCNGNSNPYPQFAARFAAKESVAKALGTGIREMKFSEIEIKNNPLGKPEVQLHGGALQVAKQKGIKEVQLTLSHSRDYAVAFALAIG